MVKMKWGLLFASALAVSSLAGCGNKSADKPKDATSQTIVDFNKPVELVFYTTNGDSQEAFDSEWGDSLRKKFPNWTITYIKVGKGTTMDDLFAAGTKFDIYYESAGVFINGKTNNIWYDMTNLIKQHGIDLNRLEPATMDQMKAMAGTQITGLPVAMVAEGLYYNKDIFDKFGVEYPKDGNTWEDVAAMSAKLTRKTSEAMYLGVVDSPVHVVRLNQLGLPLVDPKTEKSTLSDERWKKLFQTVLFDTKNGDYRNWIVNENKGKFPDSGWNEFAGSKTAAMFPYLSNFIQTNAKDFDVMNWDLASYPVFKDNPGVGAQAYPYFMGVTQISDHKDEAMEAIKYMLSDEFQMEHSRKGQLTSLTNKDIRNATGQDGKYKDKNLKAFFYDKFAPAFPRSVYDLSIERRTYAQAGDVITGKMDINTMLRNAEEDSNKTIADKKSTATQK